MNQGRQLYLASYGRIDTINSLIKRCGLYYCSWKYWHACKLHVQALGLVVAYDMYRKVVKEAFAHFDFASQEEAKRKCWMTFHDFCNALSLQGLQYNPENTRFRGDIAMRVNTKRGRSAAKEGGEKRCPGWPHKSARTGDDNNDIPAGRVTLKDLEEAKKPEGRLCGDLTKLLIHRKSIKIVKHLLKCRMCGGECYTKCGICKMPCHDDPGRGPFKHLQCFTELHSEAAFGLALQDCHLVKKEKYQWVAPTQEDQDSNRRHIQKIQEKPARVQEQVQEQPERVHTVEDSA